MSPRLDRFIITCNIVDISLWDRQTPLTSDLFEVNSERVCKWRLELRPAVPENRHALSLRLYLYCNPNRCVMTNLKVVARNALGVTWIAEESSIELRNGSFWDSSNNDTFGTVRGSREENARLGEEIWNIECELLYVDQIASERELAEVITPEMQTVKELSLNLEHCYLNVKYADMDWIKSDCRLLAHNALLYVRYPTLRPYLGRPDLLTTTNAEYMRRDGMRTMHFEVESVHILTTALMFAYTGYIDSLETGIPPPIGLHEFADRHGLDALDLNLLPSDNIGRIVLRSDVTEVFFKKLKLDVLTEDIFSFECSLLGGNTMFRWTMGGRWVHPDPRSSRRTLFLYLQPLILDRILRIKLTLVMFNRLGSLFSNQAFLATLHPAGVIEFNSDIDIVSYIRNRPDAIYRETLEIYCKIKFPTGGYDIAVERRESIFYSTFITRHCLQQLQRHMEELLEGGFFADAFLETNGLRRPVHRFILSARSEYFRSEFNESSLLTENGHPLVTVDRISLETLRFIYSGRVNLNRDLAIRLHEEAELYGIRSLTRVCSEFLRPAQNL